MYGSSCMAGGEQTEEHDAIEEQVDQSWRCINRLDELEDGPAAVLALDFNEVGGVGPWIWAWMEMHDSHLEPSEESDDYDDYEDADDD